MTPSASSARAERCLGAEGPRRKPHVDLGRAQRGEPVSESSGDDVGLDLVVASRVRQHHGHRERAAGVGELDGAPSVTGRGRDRDGSRRLHHRGLDRALVETGEGLGPGQVLLEGDLPRRLEVQGVDQHQPGERAQHTGSDELGDLVARVLGGPGVDRRPSTIGIGRVVDGLQPRAVLACQGLEERLLPRDPTLAEQCVGGVERQVGAGAVGGDDRPRERLDVAGQRVQAAVDRLDARAVEQAEQLALGLAPGTVGGEGQRHEHRVRRQRDVASGLRGSDRAEQRTAGGVQRGDHIRDRSVVALRTRDVCRDESDVLGPGLRAGPARGTGVVPAGGEHAPDTSQRQQGEGQHLQQVTPRHHAHQTRTTRAEFRRPAGACATGPLIDQPTLLAVTQATICSASSGRQTMRSGR